MAGQEIDFSMPTVGMNGCLSPLAALLVGVRFLSYQLPYLP